MIKLIRGSLNLILASGVDRSAPLIDVGGGASTLVDNLLVGGFTAISVLDISAQALAHAQHATRRPGAASAVDRERYHAV